MARPLIDQCIIGFAEAKDRLAQCPQIGTSILGQAETPRGSVDQSDADRLLQRDEAAR